MWWRRGAARVPAYSAHSAAACLPAGACCSYPCIVGGGRRAAILHYERNSEAVKDGELVLVDAGVGGGGRGGVGVALVVVSCRRVASVRMHVHARMWCRSARARGLILQSINQFALSCSNPPSLAHTALTTLTQAPSMRATPPTSRARSPSTAASAPRSATCTIWCCRCRRTRWRSWRPARPGRTCRRRRAGCCWSSCSSWGWCGAASRRWPRARLTRCGGAVSGARACVAAHVLNCMWVVAALSSGRGWSAAHNIDQAQGLPGSVSRLMA